MSIEKIVVLDTETTGPNPLEDRLVTIFVGDMNPNKVIENPISETFNMGVHIPEEASNVHGVTNEVRESVGLTGEEALGALIAIREHLHNAILTKTPIVIYNATFDTTLLNRELENVGLDPLEWSKGLVLDPLVLDRRFDKWRKGSRTLTTVSAHYGHQVDEAKAHEAAYDCLLAGSIIYSPKMQTYLAAYFTEGSQWKLMKDQVAWRAEQQGGLEEWLRKKNNDPKIALPREWPELHRN